MYRTGTDSRSIMNPGIMVKHLLSLKKNHNCLIAAKATHKSRSPRVRLTRSSPAASCNDTFFWLLGISIFDLKYLYSSFRFRQTMRPFYAHTITACLFPSFWAYISNCYISIPKRSFFNDLSTERGQKKADGNSPLATTSHTPRTYFCSSNHYK